MIGFRHATQILAISAIAGEQRSNKLKPTQTVLSIINIADDATLIM